VLPLTEHISQVKKVDQVKIALGIAGGSQQKPPTDYHQAKFRNPGPPDSLY